MRKRYLTKMTKILLSLFCAISLVAIVTPITVLLCLKNNNSNNPQAIPNNPISETTRFGYNDVETISPITSNSYYDKFNNLVSITPIYKNTVLISDSYPRNNLNIGTYSSTLQNSGDFSGWPSVNKNISCSNTTYNNFKNNDHPTTSTNSSFIDSNWIVSEIKSGTFKKHPAAANMFGDFSISPNQPAVQKNFSISKNYPDCYLTGLYAPAGEVISMTIPSYSINDITSKNITIKIGNEWQDVVKVERVSKLFRLPFMTTSFSLNTLINNTTRNPDGSVTVKFGSVFGGTIAFYFGSNSINSTGQIDFSIRDAVSYPHFQLGVTSVAEWKSYMQYPSPIVTLANDANAFFKPTFTVSNNSLNKSLFNDVIKNSNPTFMLTVFKYQTLIAEYINKNNTYNLVKRIIPFYINDYVAAGAAVNIGGSYVQAPMSWGEKLFSSDPFHFRPDILWGEMHETNHCFEQYYLFDSKQAEVYNNLISVLNFALFSPYTSWRSYYTNPFSWGWNWTSLLYNYFNPRWEGGFKLLRSDNSNIPNSGGLFSLVHILGPVKFIEFARSNIDARRNESLRTIDGKIYSMNAWSAYLICEILKADISPYLENVFSNKIGSSADSTSRSEWNTLKGIIQSKYPTYYPSTSLYASGIYVPTDNSYSSWTYCSDSAKPMIISVNESYTFDINNHTKLTEPWTSSSDRVSISSFKVVNTPQHGTTSIVNGKLVYTPNPSALGKIDEIVVEITSSLGNKSRFSMKVELLSEFSEKNYYDSFESFSQLDINAIETVASNIGGERTLKSIVNIKSNNEIDAYINSVTNNWDSYEKMINRIFDNNVTSTSWVQSGGKSNQATQITFTMQLKNPIKIDKLRFNKYNNETFFQKIAIYDIDSSNVEKVVYDNYVDNWFASNPEVNVNYFFTNKIRIKIYKASDNRDTTPSKYQTMSSKYLSDILKMPPGFISLTSTPIDFVYSSTSNKIVHNNLWNTTTYQALFNNQQLISLVSGSELSFNITNVSSLKIYGDTYNSHGTFDIYINDKKYDSVDNYATKTSIGAVLLQIDLNNNESYKITIKVTNADINTPVSIQGFGFNY